MPRRDSQACLLCALACCCLGTLVMLGTCLAACYCHTGRGVGRGSEGATLVAMLDTAGTETGEVAPPSSFSVPSALLALLCFLLGATDAALAVRQCLRRCDLRVSSLGSFSGGSQEESPQTCNTFLLLAHDVSCSPTSLTHTQHGRGCSVRHHATPSSRHPGRCASPPSFFTLWAHHSAARSFRRWPPALSLSLSLTATAVPLQQLATNEHCLKQRSKL